jgi:hypothetical protein
VAFPVALELIALVVLVLLTARKLSEVSEALACNCPPTLLRKCL